MIISVNVYLEGYDCGDIEVDVPRSIYDNVNWASLRGKNDLRKAIKDEYPLLAKHIDNAVEKAIYDGALVDLDAVADMCGQTFISHSGPISYEYKDVDDYVKRVERKYYIKID
jgi:hypothetical protein